MNVLIFNTTKKSTLFYNMEDIEIMYDGEDLESFKNKISNFTSRYVYLENIPTVRTEANYYEIMQTMNEQSSLNSPLRVPVLRIPVYNTLMFINK
jgi:hypothetical protein